MIEPELVVLMMSVPRRRGVWIGSRRGTSIVTERDGPADVCLWMEAESGRVRAATFVRAGQDPEGLARLFAQAVIQPLAGDAERPQHVLLDLPGSDFVLAGLLKDMGVRSAALSDPSPVVDVVQAMERDLKGDVGYLTRGDVEERGVRVFFQAAARLWERAPWQQVPGHALMALEGLAETPLFVSLLGSEREVFGLVILMDHQSAVKMLLGHPPDALDCVFLLYHDANESPPSVLREIGRHDWPLAAPQAVPILSSTPGRAERRLARADEMAAATVAIEVVLRMAFDGPVVGQAVEVGGRALWVTWPVGIDAPARPVSKGKGYVLRVSPEVALEVPATLTVGELHRAIQSALGRKGRKYAVRVGGREVAAGEALNAIGLRKGKSFEYECGSRHSVVVESVVRKGVVSGVRVL